MDMGKDIFEITINALKLVVIFLMMVQAVPFLVWVDVVALLLFKIVWDQIV